MRLQPPLDDRSAWSSAGRCPIEKAMEVVGSRNAMLCLREASYGTTRFDDFAERVGMSPATTSSHLRQLTDAGLLEKRTYREEGSRARQEYVLTEAGADLVPVVVGLFAWGRRYAAPPPRVELVHTDCDEPVGIRLACAAGHDLTDAEVSLRPAAR